MALTGLIAGNPGALAAGDDRWHRDAGGLARLRAISREIAGRCKGSVRVRSRGGTTWDHPALDAGTHDDRSPRWPAWSPSWAAPAPRRPPTHRCSTCARTPPSRSTPGSAAAPCARRRPPTTRAGAAPAIVGKVTGAEIEGRSARPHRRHPAGRLARRRRRRARGGGRDHPRPLDALLRLPAWPPPSTSSARAPSGSSSTPAPPWWSRSAAPIPAARCARASRAWWTPSAARGPPIS